MPLKCEPLAEGHVLPEKVEATWFCSPQQVFWFFVCLRVFVVVFSSFTQQHRMWLSTDRQGDGQGKHQDACLPLIGHDEKPMALWVCLYN